MFDFWRLIRQFHAPSLVAVIILTCVTRPSWSQPANLRAWRQRDAMGLRSVWQTQLPSFAALDGNAKISLHISPTKVWKVYDVIENGHRTTFAGPTAAHDADIRLRTLLISSRDATLEVREIPRVTVYAQTAGGRLESIDAETGQHHWSTRLGAAGTPPFTPVADDEHVVAIVGSRLYLISAETGKLLFERSLANVAQAGPTLVGQQVFVPSLLGDFQAYSLEEESRVFPPRGMESLGRATSRPRLTSAGLVWATTSGLFVGDPETRQSKFRIRARGRMIGNAALREPDRLFVSLSEGYLLAIDAKAGKTVWEFAAGERFVSPAYYADGAVYVGAADGRLFSVDAEAGTERWSTRGMSRVLAHGRNMLYGTNGNQLVAINADNGSIGGRINLSRGTQLIENTITDRLYLLSAKGLLQCLRADESVWPTIHVELPKPESDKPEEESKTTAPIEPDTPDEPSQAPEEDEWGDDETSDEDPFGGGSEDEDPFGGDPFDEEEEEDPFGI